DGSVGSPHARVGHCQASNKATSPTRKRGAFYFGKTLSAAIFWPQLHYFLSPSQLYGFLNRDVYFLRLLTLLLLTYKQQ
ncbi:hypothetical protein ACNPNQ_17845, partial [Serratia odorifera]